VPEPGPNDVLLQMHSVGICGSVVHLWQSGGIGEEADGLGGHWGDHLKPDREANEPAVPSEMDEFVKSGNYHLSPNIFFYGRPPDRAMCRYYKQCWFLLQVNSLITRAGISLGSSVLICGAAKAMGASQVISRSNICGLCLKLSWKKVK
uniref:Uncharacterized protein n=1 Tax=Pygocentrus nattereri TaxID=42514 RepID=A0A3B4BPG9_PYGNA